MRARMAAAICKYGGSLASTGSTGTTVLVRKGLIEKAYCDIRSMCQYAYTVYS
jgi:hypothetical protein